MNAVPVRAPRQRKPAYVATDNRPVVNAGTIVETLTTASAAAAALKDPRLFVESPAPFIELYSAVSRLPDDTRRRLLLALLHAEAGRLDHERTCSMRGHP